MSSVPPPIRRIVTGHDAEGRSRIESDGPSPAIKLVPERPCYRVTNLWRTVGGTTNIDASDSITEHQGVAPPPGGTVIRIIDIPPEASNPEERKRQAAATFGKLFADADHRLDDRRHPGMHVTESVDYAVMLEGELTAILDNDETVMRAGDVLIQRGTNHAWANRSGKPARVLFVLVAGKR
ncbi:MAG TPA: cupin domain-containing protein [Steroidobacteraceae bacterium]|nr:cupin domain-containing protein [Steroidobacteraceae bacterium]